MVSMERGVSGGEEKGSLAVWVGIVKKKKKKKKEEGHCETGGCHGGGG